MTLNVPYSPAIEEISEISTKAAIIAGKILAFTDDKEWCEIDRAYFRKICENCSEDTLRRQLQLLETLGYIELKLGDGRGNVTQAKRGAKMLPFTEKKGRKNSPKRVAKFAPKNKNNKNKIDISAPTRVSINQKEKFMEEFEQFWQAFFFGSYAKHEQDQLPLRERCERVFALMPQAKRDALLRDIKAGKRYDKTHFVLWFIQNYKPGIAKGTRYTQEQYYNAFGTTAYDPAEWEWCKPEGSDKFIFIKK